MAVEQHIPSLTHLRDFVNMRSKGRSTHIAQDYAQITAPSDDKIFAFVYEKFITATIAYVSDGRRGGALQQAADDASEKMRPSYIECARGMSQLLSSLPAIAAKRQQRNKIVLSSDRRQLVSLRTHLIFELEDGSKVAAYMYFSRDQLSPAEISLMETAVALAAAQHPEPLLPALVLVRAGQVHFIDSESALAQERVIFLEDEVAAYRAEWNAM